MLGKVKAFLKQQKRYMSESNLDVIEKIRRKYIAVSCKVLLMVVGVNFLMICIVGAIVRSADFYMVFGAYVVVQIVAYIITIIVIINRSGVWIKPIVKGYEMQKRFVVNAGHELKTPLTVIRANAEILELDYEEKNEWIEGIKKQTESMSDLVNDMVQLAKFESEVDSVVMQKFNISEAVYDIIEAFRGICAKKERILEIDVDKDISYLGDEKGIRQVVSILMDNAVKYCDRNGKIYVKLRERAKYIELQMENDYTPVGDVSLDKMFERFYKGEGSFNKKGSYGLGLAIAKVIVHRHGGTASAKSVDNKKINICIELGKS